MFAASFKWINSTSISFSSNGQELLVCSLESGIFTGNIANGKTKYFKPDLNITSELTLLNDKFAFITGSKSRNIYSLCLATHNITWFCRLPTPFCTNEQTLTLSKDGKYIFVCDTDLHCIWSICIQTKTIALFAGIPATKGYRNGPKEQALFYKPTNLTISPGGKYMLISDSWNECIRAICTRTKNVTTFAGQNEDGFKNGQKAIALFNRPCYTAFSPTGNYILVCDSYNHCIRKIDIKSGQVTSFTCPDSELTPDKTGWKQRVKVPTSCTFSPDGKMLFICDKNNGMYSISI